MADEGRRLLPPSPQQQWRRGYVALGCVYVLTFLQRTAYYSIQDGLSVIIPGQNFTSAMILAFQGSASFFGVFGGVLADAGIGTWLSALVGAVVFCAGGVISLVNSLSFNRSVVFVGLYTLSVGNAIFKTCVATMVGEQALKHFGTTKSIMYSYAVYYFVVNIGAGTGAITNSSIQLDSIGLYFVVSIVVCSAMFLNVVILAVGYKFFGNRRDASRPAISMLPVVKALFRRCCLCVTRGNLRRAAPLVSPLSSSQEEETRANETVKQLGKLVTIFASIIAAFAIYSQINSRFKDQAKATNLTFPGFDNRRLDCTAFYDDVFCLLFTPLLYFVIYPTWSRCGNPSQLRRMGVGLVFLSMSLLIAGVIQTVLNSCHCVSSWIMLPQMTLLSLGEVMAIISGYEFGFTQAPQGLVATVVGLFTISEGLGAYVGLLLQFVENVDSGSTTTAMFVLLGFSVFSVIIFILIARTYQYRTREELNEDIQQPPSAPPDRSQTLYSSVSSDLTTSVPS